MALHDFSEANFQSDVLDSEIPVMVDFWAPWCGPCKMMMPTVEKLAEEFDGTVKVGKVNSDENQNLAAQYNIQGLPTVVFFKGGKEVGRNVGMADETKFKSLISEVTA